MVQSQYFTDEYGDKTLKITSRFLWTKAIIAAILVLIVNCSQRQQEDTTVQVGAILPLTGSASLLGQGVRQGLELAVDELNAKGGIDGKSVTLIVEDSENDPKKGISAFHKMTATAHPMAIIAEMSSVSKALAPLAERAQTVLFATVTASHDLTSMNSWIFRNYYSTRTQGEAVAGFLARDEHVKIVGILHLTDDYGVTGKTELIAALAKHGISKVATEGYAKDATDIRAQVTKLLTANVDAMCVIAYDEALAVAFQQLRELGYQGKLCTYTGLANPKVLTQAGAAAEGAYVAMADYDPLHPKPGVQEAFIRSYQTKYGEAPSHYPAFGYDTLMTIARAAKGASSSAEVRRHLDGHEPFEGVMGLIAISPKREVEFPQAVRVVSKGKLVPLE